MSAAPPSPAIRYRSLRPEDFPDLRALWERAGLPHRPRGRDTAEAIARACRAHPDLVLAAETAGRLVGAVLGSHDGRKGWINRLAVDPEYRRRGIARELLARVEAALHRRGITVIGLLVEADNQAAQRFFTQAGYRSHAAEVLYFSRHRSPDD